MTRPTIALALGSGAGRGWAHIGVIKALERIGVNADIVCGTSVGAFVGGVWLAGQLEILENWACGLNRIRILRYLDVALRSGGLIGGKRLARLLAEAIGDVRIENLDRRFAAVTTELHTGHEIWLQHGSLLEALLASYALPGVLPPVALGGRWLVDGALVNPIPVSVCRAFGARMVIAVNLNADLLGLGGEPGTRAEPAPEYDLLADLTSEEGGGWKPTSLFRQLFGRDEGPSLFAVMVAALNIQQDRLSRSRLAGDPPDVTIAPRVGHIGLLEFDRAEEAIAAGEAAVEQAKPFLEEALQVLQI